MLIFIYSNLDSEELGQGTGKQHGDDFLDKYDFYNNWLIIFDDENNIIYPIQTDYALQKAHVQCELLYL